MPALDDRTWPSSAVDDFFNGNHQQEAKRNVPTSARGHVGIVVDDSELRKRSDVLPISTACLGS